MFIEILNKPDLKQALLAWKNSRPTEGNATLTDMLDLDLPVNEFTRVNLFIESTLIEREIFATMRNHVMWAQTSRVQDCTLFEIDYDFNPNLVKHEELFERRRSAMIALSYSGTRQDDYRLMLPIFAKTKYSISTDVRSIIKLGKYFIELSKICHENLIDQFLSFGHELFDAAESILAQQVEHKTVMKVFDRMKPYDFLYRGDIEKVSSRQGSVITVSSTLPLHLRAQLVRHRAIHFTDNFLQFLSLDILSESMTAEISVQITGTVDELTEVISKRSCWVANYSVWSYLLRKIESNMPQTADFLPCKNGVCPFHGDVVLRYEGKDPNPPCPIHLDLNNLPLKPGMAESMVRMVTRDRRPVEFWHQKISKVIQKEQ